VAQNSGKPQDGEIVLNVDKVRELMLSGGAWPVQAVNELFRGDLVAKDEDITTSAR